MNEPTKAPDPKAPDPAEGAAPGGKNAPMTAARAAKLVKRMVAKVDENTGKVVLDKDNNPVAVPQSVKADEVMSFADYGDRVVVVTTSGEKLEGAK